MKKIALVTILILLLSGLAYSQEVPEEEIIKDYHENGQLTTEDNYKDDDLIDKTELDEVYRKSIVGYWVNSNDMPYVIGVFLADGINRVLGYESINSKNLIAKIEAKWWIQNGHLFSELIKAIPPQPGYYVGHIMEDKIVEINEKEMVLINENGLEEINFRIEDTNFDQLWEESVEEAREQKRGLWKDVNISANVALARSTLRALSVASETYAKGNDGNYPSSIEALTEAIPPYLNKDYCDYAASGFSYSCKMSESGYTFIATPTAAGETGTTTYTIITGGKLSP